MKAANNVKLTNLITTVISLIAFLLVLGSGFSNWVSLPALYAAFAAALGQVTGYSLYGMLSRLGSIGTTAAGLFIAATIFYAISLIFSAITLISLLPKYSNRSTHKSYLFVGVLCILTSILGFAAVGAIPSSSGVSAVAGGGIEMVLSAGIIYIIIYILDQIGFGIDKIVDSILS
jgi:hypothetical protein